MDRYEPIETLVETPLGRLERAVDAESGREVILKTLALPGGLSSEDRALLRRRFLARAQQLRHIRHAHFCRVIDVGEEDEGPYVAMEAPRGRPLREALDRGERLSEEDALGVVAVVCDVAAAIVERTGLGPTPSPDFIIRTDEGQVRVLDGDFAIPPADARVWESGIAPTDLMLLAPERLEGGPPSESSLVFAMGALLHRLATGRWPHHGTTPVAIQRSIDRGFAQPSAPDGLPLSHSIEAIIERSLSPEPSARYDSIRAMRDAVVDAALPSTEPAEEAPPQSEPPPAPEQEPPVERPRSPWPGRIAVAVGIVAIVVALSVLIAAVGGVFSAPEESPIATLSSVPRAPSAAEPAPGQALSRTPSAMPARARSRATTSPPARTSPGRRAQPLASRPPPRATTSSATARPSGESGKIDVQCSPWGVEARVYLDDVYAGVAPHVIQRVPPGRRRITLTAPGYRAWEKSVQVNAGDYVTVIARLTPA